MTLLEKYCVKIVLLSHSALVNISVRSAFVGSFLHLKGYGVRSPPKFMVCILNCSFKFSTSKIEVYSWTLYFTLPLEFTSLENVFTLVRLAFELNFLIDLTRCTFSTRFVKLHSQTASGIGAIKRIRPFVSPENSTLHLQCLGTTPFRLL